MGEHENRPRRAFAPCVGIGFAARRAWHAAQFSQHCESGLCGAECCSATQSVGNVGEDTCPKEHSGAPRCRAVPAVAPSAAHSAPYAVRHKACPCAPKSAERERWGVNFPLFLTPIHNYELSLQKIKGFSSVFQKRLFCDAKQPLLPYKTYAFAMQNNRFWRVKA